MMKRLLAFVFTFIALTKATTCCLLALNVPQVIQEEQKLALITKLTSELLSQNHYRQQPLDNKVSSALFDRYFEVLDPTKTYFMASDIEDFEKYRYFLNDFLKVGNNQFAFEVYSCFLKRLKEFTEFAKLRLKKGFNFAKDESIEIDRSKASWCKNKKELHELWRKQLKSDLLYFRLMKRSLKKQKDNKEAKKLWEKHTPEEKILTRLSDIYNEMSKKDKIDILRFYLTALATTYGPHSGYMSPKDQEDFDISMRLSLVGIGAVLACENGYTKVVEIIPGSPAAKNDKLKPEDKIIAVAQEDAPPVDIINMPVAKVANLIRGKKGTKVTLTILAAKSGTDAVPKNITLTRDKVALKRSEASSRIEEAMGHSGKKVKIGIISLPRFYMDFKAAFNGEKNYKSSTRDVAKILEKFNKEKVAGVIMDLRSNSGGSLREAIELTGLFVSSGPIVQVRKSNRAVNVQYDPDSKIQFAKPMVILINKLTSSAAEIFAGAIKDYKRGIIVGDSRTYGKGTVLDVVELNRLLRFINQDFPAGSLKFESAIFYRVNGESTQQLGVVPDIKIPSFTECMDIGELFNTNHLPWDSINQVPHDIFDKKIEFSVDKIKKWSQARLTENPEYKILLKNLKLFEDYKKRKTVSLNEKKRWAKYLKEKKIQKNNENFLKDQLKKKNTKLDFYTQEAAHILADYVELMDKDSVTTKLASSDKRS